VEVSNFQFIAVLISSRSISIIKMGVEVSNFQFIAVPLPSRGFSIYLPGFWDAS
jgi:hypothetical protein